MQLATNPLALVFAHTVLWPTVIPYIANTTVSTGLSAHDTAQAQLHDTVHAQLKCPTILGRVATTSFFATS